MESVVFSLVLISLVFSNAAVSVPLGDTPPQDTEDIYQLVHDLTTQFCALKNDYETFRVEDKATIEILKSEMRQIQQQNGELQHSLETQRPNHNLQLKDINTKFDWFKSDMETARSEDASTISVLKSDISLVKQQNKDLRRSLTVHHKMQSDLEYKYKVVALELKKLRSKTESFDQTPVQVNITNRVVNPQLTEDQHRELATNNRETHFWNQMNENTSEVTAPTEKKPAFRVSEPSPFADVVAFHVFLGQDHSSLGDDQTIVFDSVMTNFGHDYSHHTGVFTCSVAGVYVFTWVIEVKDEHYIETDLTHNGLIKAALAVKGTASSFNTGSQTVVLALNVGDVVFVRVNSGVKATLVQYACTFTGFLLN